MIQIATVEELCGQEPKKFRFKKGDDYVDAFVLKYQGEIKAYLNMCMHEPIPLDIGTGKFWNAAKTELVCKNHGAKFKAEDGTCTAGPCPDTFLKRVRVIVKDDVVYLDR